MALLQVDGLEIEVNEGRIIWCGPAEGSKNEDQALCCDWGLVPEDLKEAFLMLQGQWSGMAKTFLKDNRDALAILKGQMDAMWRADREAWEEHKLSLVDAGSHCNAPGDYI